jgi:hypothetical protein
MTSPIGPIPVVFNQDFGLGYCLQCLGEYKQRGDTPPFPNWACCYAPSPVGVLGMCYGHVVVNRPASLLQANTQIPDLSNGGPLIPGTSTAQHRRPR